MKKKYVIMRSNGANNYWSCLGPKIPPKDKYIEDEIGDRFIGTSVEEAVLFDSYIEAEQTIKSFNLPPKDISTETKVKELYYKGAGIYKIEEIYIIDKN